MAGCYIYRDRSMVETVTDRVFIAKTGEKYHRDGCGSLSRSKIPISRADAIARGYTPCHNCNHG